jgi:small nuclear ribonucleoprotein (snRNP)-like protein
MSKNMSIDTEHSSEVKDQQSKNKRKVSRRTILKLSVITVLVTLPLITAVYRRRITKPSAWSIWINQVFELNVSIDLKCFNKPESDFIALRYIRLNSSSSFRPAHIQVGCNFLGKQDYNRMAKIRLVAYDSHGNVLIDDARLLRATRTLSSDISKRQGMAVPALSFYPKDGVDFNHTSIVKVNLIISGTDQGFSLEEIEEDCDSNNITII